MAELDLHRPDILYGMHDLRVTSGIDALLYADTHDVQNILEYLSLNRVLMGNGFFCIAVSRVTQSSENHTFETVLEYNRQFAELVEETLLKKAIFYMAPVRGVIVCILALPHSTEDRQKLDHMRSLFLSAYHSATESMLEHSGISVLTAVGPLFPDAENIPGSFQRVLDMLEFQRYFGATQGVFSAGKLSALPVWNLHRVSDLDNQCRSQCSLLLSGKQKSFFSSVHKSIQELHANVPSSLQQFKADCFHYISALIFHLTDRQIVSENAVKNLDIYGMIDRTESESMLFQTIDTLLSELTKTYFQQQQEASFLSASNMRSYIQEHYTDANLTVTGVAEVFQMTQPAFSAHYKRKLGVFPLEDINKCRCQHAYRMLEAGEKDLDKILHASGFNSSATMHRLIKRFYNATPAQLRRSFMARE